jgi:hypothetical protein
LLLKIRSAKVKAFAGFAKENAGFSRRSFDKGKIRNRQSAFPEHFLPGLLYVKFLIKVMSM